MNIKLQHIKEKDVFEIQVVDEVVRSHFLLSRAQVNELRSLLEKALLTTAKKQPREKSE